MSEKITEKSKNKYISMAIAEDYHWYGFGTTEGKAKEALVNQYNEFYSDNLSVEKFEKQYEPIGICIWMDADI